MRKISFIFSILFMISVNLFAESYKLVDISYNIENCGIKLLSTTKKNILEQALTIKKDTFYDSEDDIVKLIEDTKRELINLRAFQKIDISYEIMEEVNDDAETDISIPFTVYIKLIDSIHLLALPYPKFDSVNGLDFKLKAKDTNFIGTLNPMNTDVFIKIPNADSENKETSFGFNFSYDFPFKIGIFDAAVINNYGISYIIGEDLPEWNAQTGLMFQLPLNNISLKLELYQYSYANSYYKNYDDRIYFTEEAKFSTPITLFKFEYLKKIILTPYVYFNYNWDYNNISYDDIYLSTPNIYIGYSIATSRVDWLDNYRKGISFLLNNNVRYNFMYNDISPYLASKIQGYYYFNLYDGNFFSKIGLASSFYIFNYFDIETNHCNYGELVGLYLRGIRDYQFFGNNGKAHLYTTSSAIIFNLDFPIHLFTTNVNWPVFKHLNFDLQVAPFIDVGLINNRVTNRIFDYRDGFYAAGLEILVYPVKWSSFTVRASFGVDIGQILLKNVIDTSWRTPTSKFEYSIGVGLSY